MIDIHTHKISSVLPDTFTIRNIRYQEAADLKPGQGYYSVGLHPWDAGGTHLNLDLLDQLMSRPYFIALGEIGLDKFKGPEPEIQTQIFIDQARIAEAHNKPVIIHCVKSWESLLTIKHILAPSVPWIIHGFNGKPELAGQLITEGFYLSFGAALLHEDTRLADSLRYTPSSRLFLETDDSSASISSIYEKAASIRNLSLIELKIYISENFETVFSFHANTGLA
jgi:TatD DNase family protein